MKVTVYANWRKETIISEKEYKEMIEETVKKYVESCSDFADWLNGDYYASDIWEMSESTKKAINEEYREACHTWAEDEVNDHWKPYEIEV